MKVSEMIEYLKKLPQDAIVVTAIDDEGNGFNEVYNESPTLGYFLNEDGGGFVSAEQVEESPEDYEHYTESGVQAVCLN